MSTNKKGLSPVIATTLLVLMTVIIAVLIFVWVKSFFGEEIKKNLGGEDELIQNFCERVQFTADVTVSGTITIQNSGEVPIYGIEVKKEGLGSMKSLGIARSRDGGTKSGDTEELIYSLGENTIVAKNNLVLVPILLGTTNEAKKSYPCDSKFGVKVVVSE